MTPRLNLVERLSVAVLIVLAEPDAFGLGEAWQGPDALAYGPIAIIGVALLVDGHRLALALRAAADALDRPEQ